MKNVLIYCVFIIIYLQAVAQNSFDGLYTNEDDEFVCIDKDTICFKINYHDAFASFAIGIGNFEINKKGKGFILQSDSLISQTSVLKEYPRKDDSLVITILDADNVPIKWTMISIAKLQNYSAQIICFSDEYGQLRLNNEQIQMFNNSDVFIRTITLGFVTRKSLMLKRGNNYVIQSVLPVDIPFGINDKDKNLKIKVNITDTNQLQIEIGNYLKAILNKRKDHCQCSESLLRTVR